jgi:hypothetical protein
LRGIDFEKKDGKRAVKDFEKKDGKRAVKPMQDDEDP